MSEKEKPTIGMLLDIDNLYGENEGRLAPVLTTLLLCSAPILFYIYFSLFLVVPIYVFIPIEVVFSLRVLMIIPGKERQRVKIFKKQLLDNYTNTASYMNIKTIHPDGCIEYVSGRIMYLVCCFNGTSDSEVQRSIQLRKLLENMIGGFEYDTYLLNVTEAPALRQYYDKVSNFQRNTSAKNFIGIIDHNIKLTEETSVVQSTVYAIKGHRSDWKTIKGQIDSALGSRVSRCYKSIFRVSDSDMINELLDRDIDSIISIADLLRKKYATQNYFSSKVLAYDLPEDSEIVLGQGSQKPVIPKPPKSSFHTVYKE